MRNCPECLRGTPNSLNVRSVLGLRPDIEEKRIFGRMALMLNSDTAS
jgi:hypothetical protein